MREARIDAAAQVQHEEQMAQTRKDRCLPPGWEMQAWLSRLALQMRQWALEQRVEDNYVGPDKNAYEIWALTVEMAIAMLDDEACIERREAVAMTDLVGGEQP